MAILSVRRNGVSHFYHHDGLGSTVQLTDANQNVTDSYVYRAFGEEQAVTGTTPNPLRFVGNQNYHTDGKSGLVLLGRRYLNHATGRFETNDPEFDGVNWYMYTRNVGERIYGADFGRDTSLDPVGQPGGGINLYLYVLANPVNLIDPSGLSPTSLIKPCPTTPPKKTDPGWCYDDDFSPWTHWFKKCYRQIPKKPGDGANQCCYKKGKLVEESPDTYSPVAGKHGDGTCKWSCKTVVCHGFWDILWDKLGLGSGCVW